MIACVTFLHPISVSRPSSVCSQIFRPAPSCESPAPLLTCTSLPASLHLLQFTQLVLLCHIHLFTIFFFCFILFLPAQFPFETNDKPVETCCIVHQFTEPKPKIYLAGPQFCLSLSLDIFNQINPDCIKHNSIKRGVNICLHRRTDCGPLTCKYSKRYYNCLKCHGLS